MLFGYPTNATADNWLHDCLCEIINSIHQDIEANLPMAGWPGIIPASYRGRLSSRTGLRSRLIVYRDTVATLDNTDRQRVLRAVGEQNAISSLLAARSDCETLAELPCTVRQPISDLFEYAFGLLTPLGTRDNLYRQIYDSSSYHVCPFCGCEYFDAPGAPREALDHYLAASLYPFAGANLRNLVPMGDRCNSRYKLTQDILRRAGGARRRSFDPYQHDGIRVVLDNSEPFAGRAGQLPRWQIDFDPSTEEVTTWDEIFQIRTRYIRDALDPHFPQWLWYFGRWCRSLDRAPQTLPAILEAIERFRTYQEDIGFSDRAFLIAAVFRMLRAHCDSGNERLIEFMKDVVATAAG